MYKYLFLSLGLLLTLSFTFAALPDYKWNGQDFFVVEHAYNKGWNLVPTQMSTYFSFKGFYGVPPVNNASDTNFMNSALRFTFNPKANKFFGANQKNGKFYGVNTKAEYDQQLNALEENRYQLNFSGDWVYFDNQRTLTWLIPKDITDSYMFKNGTPTLFKGWNLLVVPYHTDANFWGDCKLEKVYLWYSLDQKWILVEDKSMDDLKQEILKPKSLANGFAIKVTNDCTLMNSSTVDDVIPDVPSMPSN